MPVIGRTVTLVTGPANEKVKGELLVVEKDRLYVRAEDGVREVPLGAVSEARVKRHGSGKSKAYAWSLIGGLVTGGALAAACSSVEDTGGCAGVGLVTLGVWMGIGALQLALVRVVEPTPAVAPDARAAAAVRRACRRDCRRASRLRSLGPAPGGRPDEEGARRGRAASEVSPGA